MCNCQAVAAKNFKVFRVTSKSFHNLDGETFMVLYYTIGWFQWRGTKMVKVLCGLSYEDRVRSLNIFPLFFRRVRGDLVLAHRILSVSWLSICLISLFYAGLSI